MLHPLRLLGVPRAQHRTFQRNGFLFYAESGVDAGYLIRSGHVRCFLLDADGRETTTAILGPGHFVGSAAVLGLQMHQEFCEALTQVEAWSLPADDLRRACASSALVYGWLLGSIGRRLELALALRRDISLLSASDRADDIQARLYLLSGVDPATVRQTSLASLLQIRPETLARARSSRHLPPAGEQALQPQEEIIGVGRREFSDQQCVVSGHLPRGCIGKVDSGFMELSLTAGGSRAVVVETLGPGDLFGFSSLLALPPVAYSFKGLGSAAISIIPTAQFLRGIPTSDADSGAMVLRLTERLQLVERQLARTAMADLADRLVHVLREVASERDGARYVPATWSHDALARHLGVRRETVTRGLATLVKTGVIARQGRRILMVSSDKPVSPAVHPIEAPAAPPRPHTLHPNKCRLCGLRTPGTLCIGCADRLERDLERNPAQACPNCGRHRELCQMIPCKHVAAAAPTAPDGGVVWVPTSSIDEPAAERNSRRTYPARSIQELAASLQKEGFLQPICVRRKGTRFELVFGVRRFRAALQAGLSKVPCTVRNADDERAFLLNAMENLHREQLSNVERVAAIERLATSGLGVREISRRTGFNPSTISRWLRINSRPVLKQALEDNRIDIARAVILVDAPASAVSSLLEVATQNSAAELRRRVAAIKAGGKDGRADDRRHLADALRSLRRVHPNVDEPLLVQKLQLELSRISGVSANRSGTSLRTLNVTHDSPRRLLTRVPSG